MLHLEIRQENSQYYAYSVDHNSNDFGVDLLRGNDFWKEFQISDGTKKYFSLIFDEGIWRIRSGDEIKEAGNPRRIDSNPLFSENDNILGIVIALFNAAPGQLFLSQFSREVSSGSTEPLLANRLAAHTVFVDGVMGDKPNLAEQVKELMDHFGLVADGEPGSAASEAEKYFTARIPEVGHGVTATEATFYLLSNDLLGNKILKEFYDTALLFKLKILIADNYSASNSSTDLATLQEVLAGITLQIGTNGPDIIEGSSSGGVNKGGGGGDKINHESLGLARDISVYENATESQISDTNGNNVITILDEALGDDIDPFFDSVTNFSVGTADTDDRIDLSNFNFTGTQPGLVDASTRMSITTDLASVPDLFSDEEVGDRGLAFLEHVIDDVTTTYLFIDANNDSDFTAADDTFLELVGVDDLIDANFIYYTGVSAIDPTGTAFSLTAADSVAEGDGLTYSVTASEPVATDTDVVFTVEAGDSSAADQGTGTTNLNDFVTGTSNPVTVTILAGQSTASFSVTGADDSLTELAETYSVTAVVDGSTLEKTTTLLDRQSVQTILTAAAASVTEGDALTYTVTASEAVAADTDVVFTVEAGDSSAADQGTGTTNLNDFVTGTFNPVTVTILAGQTTTTFSVTGSDDGITELSETYSVSAVVDGTTLTETTTLLDSEDILSTVLTTGADNFPGSSDVDSFTGFVGTGSTSTMTVADTIGGAGGIDTFNITNASGAGVTNTNGALVSGIEIFNLRGLTAADTFAFDAAAVSGVTEINGFLSLGALTVTNVPSEATFTGGAGDDMITTSISGQTGAINAGAGNDTLTLAAAAHIDTTAEGAIYSGFEVLSSATAAIDMDLITGSTITAIKVGAAGSNVTDMNATQAANVMVIGALGATTLGVKDATQVGTADTLALTISDGDTTTSEALVAGGDLTLAGVETITIDAVDDATFTTMANIIGMNSLTVTGGGDVSFTTGAHALESNATFDFSTLTGTSTFNAAAATTIGFTDTFTFTGGAGIDTVTDHVIGGNIISTGAGNDVITLTQKTNGIAATTVIGGAGADAVTAKEDVPGVDGKHVFESIKFVYNAGDSVSDSSTTGISASLTDTIANLNGDQGIGGSGSDAEFDTEVQATDVTVGSTDVVLGTTVVTNGGDFFVNIDSATVTHIYQDTDSDGIIEAGEFAVSLTGITIDTLDAADFFVSGGDLQMLTAFF